MSTGLAETEKRRTVDIVLDSLLELERIKLGVLSSRTRVDRSGVASIVRVDKVSTLGSDNLRRQLRQWQRDVKSTYVGVLLEKKWVSIIACGKSGYSRRLPARSKSQLE
jgi:hypothetical protein